jgi:hypothetical protein
MMTTSNVTMLGHYQIEVVAAALLKAAHEHDTDNLPYLVQALTIRIIELNGALMGAADVELGATANDADVVYLKNEVLGFSCFRGEAAQ